MILQHRFLQRRDLCYRATVRNGKRHLVSASGKYLERGAVNDS